MWAVVLRRKSINRPVEVVGYSGGSAANDICYVTMTFCYLGTPFTLCYFLCYMCVLSLGCSC